LNLTPEEIDLLNEGLLCRLMFIKGDIGRCSRCEKGKKVLSSSQMELVWKMEKLSSKLQRERHG
jgi:hypothetical protein